MISCRRDFWLCSTLSRPSNPARGCKLLSWLSYPLRKHWSVLLCYQSERQRGEPLNLSVSLDETADDEDGALRAETIPDATALEAFEDILGREWLRQLRQIEEEEIDRLSPALAKLIRCRYFEGMTLEQLARLRGVSAERVRQLEQRALEQLRKPRPALRLCLSSPGKETLFHCGVREF